MLRAVLDTNVLVSIAIMPAGKPGQIFQHAAVSFELLCSEYILAELAAVLARPHIQKKYRDLVTLERREQYVTVLRSLATLVDVQTSLEAVSDAADNPVLAAAVDGRADFLVTGDPHLLALKAYAGCQVMTPDQFLHLLFELGRGGPVPPAP